MIADNVIVGLRDIAAPLVYLLAAIAFVLALKSAVNLRLATRTRGLVAAGLLLALLGVGFERGPGTLSSLGGFAAVLAGGVLLGVWLGRSVAHRAAPAQLAFVPGLAGTAATLVAVSTWPGAVGGAGTHLALLGAAVLGATAALLGAGLTWRGSPGARSSAAAAAVALLAGWAIALLGLALGNAILLIAGGVMGTAALALARVVAGAAGVPLSSIVRGVAADNDGYAQVRACGSDEAAMLLETARNVIVVPGFGMPAAQAQHAIKEIAEQLEKRGASVVYAINPVAGCLPGHMNIALDEANVAHDKLVDLARAQHLVAAADAVLVVGANDTVNATAAADRTSPLYGIDALDLTTARLVLVVKRTLGPGAGGVRNALFEGANTLMLLGDGKRVLQALATALKGGAAH